MLIAALLALASLLEPERLTAGPGDRYLGALSPDQQTLYFVSSERATAEVYAQSMQRGIPQLAFDDGADASWPRPSPDGKQLLYISYQTDAAGDLCIRTLPQGERRCLTGESSADVQAVWLPDGKSIALVTREGLHGDFSLRRITLDGRAADVLVGKNLTSPTFSPDGKWVAYVPVERVSPAVGPSFLVRGGYAIEIARVGQGKPERVALDLPGASAFPAFSLDGKFLYFTQFLNDTNYDGQIDGNDHGVLFRAPFGAGKLGAPEQLTSARWSCQYPLPARERLIATCLAHGSLDVFSLPLEGAIPKDWDPARLDDELSASTDRWEKLLLLSRRAGEPRAHLVATIELHLELGEYESAAFYAAKLTALGEPLGMILAELTAHRKAERALSRGMITETFVREARARLVRLSAVQHPLARLAESELHDTLGEESEARARIQQLDTSDPVVAAHYAERLLALHRDDREALLAGFEPLAKRDLGHAQAYVRELVRGAPAVERERRLTQALARAEPKGALALLLQLELALNELTAATQEEVRERVFELYRAQKDFALRKVLVATTLERALRTDSESLLYNFATTWVSFVPEQRAARQKAEQLYRDAVLERAYVEEARGAVGAARGYFFGVTLQTLSLEAHAGFIEMRLAEGKDPLADYEKRAKETPELVLRFARAYVAARALPGLSDAATHEREAQRALAELAEIAEVAPQRAEVHQLWGYVAHQRWLRRGEPLSAVEANSHYLLALALGRDDPRKVAALLDALGRLHSLLGNFGLAESYLDQRAKLPFANDGARLSHCLAHARSRYFMGDAGGAAEAVDRCEESPEGRALALDRSALYHLSHGHYERARERYAELWPMVAQGTGPEGARNRVTTQTGWAAAALAGGKPDEALAHVGEAERMLSEDVAPFEGPYGRLRPPPDSVPFDRRLLLQGLRAQAQLERGDTKAAREALAARRERLTRRLDEAEIDEDRLELARVEAQLALVAHREHHDERALEHIRTALLHWDAWSRATGTPLEETGLAILCGYAELVLFAKVPFPRKLPERLAATYRELSRLRNPAWESSRARLQTYLTLFDLRRDQP